MRTTVVGSYSVPDWYPVLQEAVVAGRASAADFRDAKSVSARAAIKDQEMAGIEIISDGELFRRDDNRFGPPNAMINYFAAKIQGFSPELKMKSGISPVAPQAGLPAPVIVGKLESSPLSLTDELQFLRANSNHACKIAMAGPHMFSRVCWDEHYGSVEAVAKDMAAVINDELLQLDRNGCDVIQLDEPIIWYLLDDRAWAIKIINSCFDNVRNATRAVHLCQGNFNPDPSAHMGLRIFPAEFSSIIQLANELTADAILLAFSAFDVKDLNVFKDFPKDKILGLGVVDVQSTNIETPDEIARTIDAISGVHPYERLWVHPDCGFNHLPRDIAAAKMKALAEGSHLASGIAF
jgi:5-methyltetrahydropteroyltriglutamate--homocysteine methyltransferase